MTETPDTPEAHQLSRNLRENRALAFAHCETGMPASIRAATLGVTPSGAGQRGPNRGPSLAKREFAAGCDVLARC